MDRIVVKIPTGFIVVEAKGTGDYPGVYVSFSKDGTEVYAEDMLSCTEYDEVKHKLMTRSYNDVNEEPIAIVYHAQGDSANA